MYRRGVCAPFWALVIFGSLPSWVAAKSLRYLRGGRRSDLGRALDGGHPLLPPLRHKHQPLPSCFFLLHTTPLPLLLVTRHFQDLYPSSLGGWSQPYRHSTLHNAPQHYDSKRHAAVLLRPFTATTRAHPLTTTDTGFLPFPTTKHF